MATSDELPELARAAAVAQRAPGRDLSSVRCGRANSGKWHLVGEHACPNGQINANINATRPVTALSRGTREWCYYCEMQLEIYRLQAEVDRLEEDDST